MLFLHPNPPPKKKPHGLDGSPDSTSSRQEFNTTFSTRAKPPCRRAPARSAASVAASIRPPACQKRPRAG
eukprot:2851358-Alexandrium_andersonii.AAC.1